MNTSTNTQSYRKEIVKEALNSLIGSTNEFYFDEIYPNLEWINLRSRDVLFNENDLCDGLYIVITGKLQALVSEDGARKKVGEIVPGETVGEVAIFTDEPRNATVQAIRDCVLVKMSKKLFSDITDKHPKVILNIAKLMMLRLTNVNKAKHGKRTLNKTVAILPLGEVNNFESLCSEVVKSFKKIENTLFLNSKITDSEIRYEEISQSDAKNEEAYQRVTEYLYTKESEYDKLLLVGDSNMSEWNQRCIRQADVILLVGDGSEPGGNTELDKFLSGDEKISDANQYLIMLHADNVQNPEDTKRWFIQRDISRVFHAKLNAHYIDRISRFICGKSVGLTLAGGGARGAAHLGVYKALIENNIPVDMVCGTSMGGMVAGGLSLDKGIDEVISYGREKFLSNPVNDFNIVPVISLLKGKKIDGLLLDYFGDLDILDLWRPFFCVSSNLSQSKAVNHYSGNVCKAIRASVAIPGVFPPVLFDGDFHVDGGIFNNLPIDIMKDFGSGIQIAVNMNEDKGFFLDDSKLPNDYRILKNRWLKKNKEFNVPTMMSSIIQSITLSSDHHTQSTKGIADLYINLDLSKFGMMEVKAFDQVVEIGYNQTLKALDKGSLKL